MFVPTAVLFVKRAQKRRIEEEEEESKSCKSFFSSSLKLLPKKVKGELHICESDLLEATIIKYSSLRLLHQVEYYFTKSPFY